MSNQMSNLMSNLMSKPLVWAALAAAACVIARPAAADKGTGTIAGTVVWKGKAPPRAALDRRTDPVCAKVERLSEDVVVEDGKLRDVHVRIKVGTAGSHTAPTAPVVVAQSQCMYEPRVVGVMAGQSIEIRNVDPTFHNVRGNLGTKILWNLGQAAKAAPIVRDKLGAPGEVVSLHCDVHPWMAAWAVVTDHPYFAVTGADGAFTIANVPAGSYTLEAWHPTLGLQSVKVKVRKGKTAKATFTFSAPAPAP